MNSKQWAQFDLSIVPSLMPLSASVSKTVAPWRRRLSACKLQCDTRFEHKF